MEYGNEQVEWTAVSSDARNNIPEIANANGILPRQLAYRRVPEISADSGAVPVLVRRVLGRLEGQGRELYVDTFQVQDEVHASLDILGVVAVHPVDQGADARALLKGDDSTAIGPIPAEAAFPHEHRYD